MFFYVYIYPTFSLAVIDCSNFPFAQDQCGWYRIEVYPIDQIDHFSNNLSLDMFLCYYVRYVSEKTTNCYYYYFCINHIIMYKTRALLVRLRAPQLCPLLSVLGMTLNCILWYGSSSGAVGIVYVDCYYSLPPPKLGVETLVIILSIVQIDLFIIIWICSEFNCSNRPVYNHLNLFRSSHLMTGNKLFILSKVIWCYTCLLNIIILYLKLYNYVQANDNYHI